MPLHSVLGHIKSSAPRRILLSNSFWGYFVVPYWTNAQYGPLMDYADKHWYARPTGDGELVSNIYTDSAANVRECQRRFAEYRTEFAQNKPIVRGALTIAGGIAAAGGQGGGFSFAGAGAGSGHTIKNTVKAATSDGSTVTTTGTGAVSLTATDTSKIIADAGGAAIAAAGGQGGGASISVGISIADNEIGNQVLAVIDASAVNSAAGVGLFASSSGTIDAFTFGGAVAISGGMGGGLGGAGVGLRGQQWDP